MELPSIQMLDDSRLYAPRHSHERVLKTWKEEFDALYGVGLFMNLTLQACGDSGSGRARRVRVVDEFLTHVQRWPGVLFMTCAELAAWSKQHHPQAEAALV